MFYFILIIFFTILDFSPKIIPINSILFDNDFKNLKKDIEVYNSQLKELAG